MSPLSQVLSDDQKRQIYDQYGAEGLKSGAGGMGDFGGFTNPYDLFDMLMNGAHGHPRDYTKIWATPCSLVGEVVS